LFFLKDLANFQKNLVDSRNNLSDYVQRGDADSSKTFGDFKRLVEVYTDFRKWGQLGVFTEAIWIVRGGGHHGDGAVDLMARGAFLQSCIERVADICNNHLGSSLCP